MKNIFQRRQSVVIVVGITVLTLFVPALPTYSFHREPNPHISNVGGSKSDARDTGLSTQVQFPSGLPLRLRVPSIGVDASIEYVGLTKAGAMEVPKLHPNVAWYSLGTRPGDRGSAVIAGHYSWKKNGGDEIFRNPRHYKYAGF